MNNKCRLCRRASEKLFLKGDRCATPKCAMVKRNYVPGFHGPKASRRRLSDYGSQLAEKQKMKRMYGLREKQFRLIFEKAAKKSGDAGKNFLRALEMRLDNVVYRLGWATSRSAARQLVNHGHFIVNDRKVDIPSFTVKVGQIVKAKKSSLNNRYFKTAAERLKKSERPSWLNLETDGLLSKVLHEPKDGDLPQNVNAQVIIEYYSK